MNKRIYFYFCFIAFVVAILLFYFSYLKIKKKPAKNYSENSNKIKKFFFLEKEEKINYCKNYGIMIYNYKLYKAGVGNIGDYIQSLAALQFLPKNCLPIFVDRDNIRFYNGTNVTLIMNGWHYVHRENLIISESILPIFVSYHINNIRKINSIFINSLKKTNQ